LTPITINVNIFYIKEVNRELILHRIKYQKV